ncbi:MAG TPA: hypothetical protein DCY64_00545 [Hydrogenophaga sp.]|uniref:Uncharacterized protein n=1 Tax=Hydrogenophaga aromaticivorans TaxID=2610898 RepID=A0A7Y8KYY6_9BURK|nr:MULTISPECIES: hypothetical protein [Hydrogenophaga]MBU4181599.1 hypothetical protein [Gammaproteobacteria bacterium]OGA74067.1 MAG: hypothetical protein A2X73_15500 [Burkholderiales bacterium GWE1_65_30]OGA90020.1 MAG: hypothetical protein A2X72_13205 [Burkholderiales bacterium GWF1_66_17]OGB36010.1 MAG: hypothetical protein A3I16_19100 [Burkholderiales bacterium RIFCSPLOWO2_02_FULL_66_35]OGB37421.1 MAG: hypothetical protein A3B67_13540 [Burkholderiales bacterium RIFCSPHIGHO2_02_FULL_66_10]
MNPKPSYLGAFLRHPANRTALLAAGVVAIFASIPMGLAGLALVGTLAVGTEILAALMVPSLPSFKAWVDREAHHQGLSQRRKLLIDELSARGESGALSTYQHMWERVQALYETAGDRQTTLTRQDVEKLEALTVDYLGLCSVNASLRRRKEQISEDQVNRRIASVEAQLRNPALGDEEARQLRATLAEYAEVLNRARRLAVRRSALEATLLAMPDKMEEVYQLVITSPYATDMGSKLEDSLSRLRIAEEVAAEFDDADLAAFGNNAPRVSASGSAANAAARQASQRQRT